MNDRELKLLIIEYAEVIAGILVKGKDCEIRRSRDGISIAEVGKKVVIR